MPLNTPDPTHRCLRERYGTASRETSALRELVRAEEKERALGDVDLANLDALQPQLLPRSIRFRSPNVLKSLANKRLLS